MTVYILKRLLAMIPTLLGITFITFAIVNFAPGDPVAATFRAAEGNEKGAGEGGAAGSRLEDAKNAKRKLLGMLKEDFAVRAWDAAGANALPRATNSAARAPDFERRGRLCELPAWPRALRLAADGRTLYVGAEDRLVRAVDAATGEIRRAYEGHGAAVWAVNVSADGSAVASADSDGAILFFSAADGTRLGAVAPLGLPVRRVAFLPDGRSVVSACDDGVVRVHSVPDGKLVRELRDHTSYVAALALSRDGKRLWTGGYDRKLREWDPATGGLVATTEGHKQAINDIVLAPDESFLLTACDDNDVRRVPLGADGRPSGPAVTWDGHYKAVTAVAVSPDGKRAYSGGADESVRAWDVATGTQIAQSAENTGLVYSLVVSRDGGRLWSASSSWSKTPIWERYFHWLGKTLTLDFDRSFVDNERVIDKIWEALPITIGLAILDILIIYLIAIPIGVAAAVKRGTRYDAVTSIVLFLLAAVPSFWAATMLIMQFSSEKHMNVLPSIGLHDPDQADLAYLPWLWDWAKHLIMPVIVMTYAGFAGLSRYARTSMLETLTQDYVRTARAKGLSETIVVYKHALRNSLITIVTLLANLLPALIGGSVIVEYIFTINGMGRLDFDAILQRDYPVIMAITTFSAVLTLVGVLVSDILYTVVDPRIAHE